MKNNSLPVYRGYTATLQFSIEDDVYFGELNGIEDAVTFEFETMDEADLKFREAVDDYIEFCQEIGKEPERPGFIDKEYLSKRPSAAKEKNYFNDKYALTY